MSTLSDDNNSVINIDELLTRCMGNVEIAERILSKFQERFGFDLDELEQGLAEQNAEAVAQAAHRIKGASANVSAKAICDIATEIEQMGRSQQLTEVSAQIDKLRTEWTRFLDGIAMVDLAQCVPR